MNQNWQTLGQVKAKDLSAARLTLHRAVQLLRAVGQAYIKAQSDDSHQNMEWMAEYHGFASNPFGDRSKYRLAVDFFDFELLFLNDGGPVIDSLKLDNTNRETAIQWVKKLLGKYGFASDNYEVHDDLIPAPEKPFSFSPPLAFHEAALWYGNLNNILTEFSGDVKQASPVRCWPHHFDLATLVSYEKQSIGVGLSPGDGYYDEPYVYITPWPFPELSADQQPKIPAGKYHTHEWNGLVLTGSEIVESPDQFGMVTNFIRGGFKVAQELVGR